MDSQHLTVLFKLRLGFRQKPMYQKHGLLAQFVNYITIYLLNDKTWQITSFKNI